MAAASIYLACRVEGYPRTLEEISAVTGIEKKTISKVQNTTVKELEIILPVLQPSSLIPRICNQLNLPASIIESCRQICNRVTSLSLFEGAAPQVIACLVIILISLINKCCLDIDKLLIIANCSLMTIKRHYETLRNMFKKVLPISMQSYANILPSTIDKSIIDELKLNKTLTENHILIKVSSFGSKSSQQQLEDSISNSENPNYIQSRKRPPSQMFTGLEKCISRKKTYFLKE